MDLLLIEKKPKQTCFMNINSYQLKINALLAEGLECVKYVFFSLH